MFDNESEKDTVTVEGEGKLVDILHANGTARTLKNPDGTVVMDGVKPRTAKMRIFGTFSEQFTAKQNEISLRNRRRTKAKSEEEAEAREASDNYETWAACVGDWDLLIGGKRADPIAVFKRYPEIYTQVINEARDHVSFSEMVLRN